MNSPDTTNEEAPECFKMLLKDLKAHALFAATGCKAEKDDSATIGETLAAICIPDGFTAGYRPLAVHDVVGKLFAADPRIAERVSARQYGELPATTLSHPDLEKRLEIQKYLRNAGFEHLLLAGLNSRLYGMAWIVAYRGPPKSPAAHAFSDEELEIARYTAPAILFNFLHTRAKQNGTVMAPTAAAMGGPVPLDSNRLRIAILEAQGFGATEIARRISCSVKAVNNLLTDIRARLGVEGRHITLIDLEHFAALDFNKYASP